MCRPYALPPLIESGGTADGRGQGPAVGTEGGAALIEARQFGTAAAVTAAILQGVHVVRVHDVVEMAQAARVADAILEARAA